MERCSQCGKEPSGLVSQATHCEHCGAPLEPPAEPVTFKCYVCGQAFDGDKASSERRCDACRALYGTAAAGAGRSLEDEVRNERLMRAARAFGSGLLAVPAFSVAVLVFQSMPMLSIVLLVFGAALAGALGRLGVERRREPLLESVAGLAGAAASVWLSVQLYRLLGG